MFEDFIKINWLNHVFVSTTVMYWNEIMSHKARTLVAKLRRQSRVRPYRERAEITPLLSAQNGHKTNGKSTAIDMNSHLYPIVEVFEEGKKIQTKCQTQA